MTNLNPSPLADMGNSPPQAFVTQPAMSSKRAPTRLKAIETRYQGCIFRSRLEARWAVFFDALDIPWEYEKEGYDLGEAGWYLPDFWLPQQQCFFEVKGTVADFSAKLKAFYLSATLQHVVIISSGTMGLRATTPDHYVADPSHRMLMFAGKAWDHWNPYPHNFSQWEATLIYNFITASKELTPGHHVTWEDATQLWQSHEGRRSMVATTNMADMAVGKEPRYQWGRCTCASWQYKPEHHPFLAFSEPDALPIEIYSKLYQAMQTARAARF